LAFQHHRGHDDADSRDIDVGQICRDVEAALDIEKGPTVVGTLIHHGCGERTLFLGAHHLVVDAVSWRILLEDLNLACEQLTTGKRAELQPATASFRQWTTLLQEWVANDQARAEADYWVEQLRGADAVLPVDFADTNSLSSVDVVLFALSESDTERLKQRATAH